MVIQWRWALGLLSDHPSAMGPPPFDTICDLDDGHCPRWPAFLQLPATALAVPMRASPGPRGHCTGPRLSGGAGDPLHENNYESSWSTPNGRPQPKGGSLEPTLAHVLGTDEKGFLWTACCRHSWMRSGCAGEGVGTWRCFVLTHFLASVPGHCDTKLHRGCRNARLLWEEQRH